jgi:NAD(P)-dependent dehydrogenase (short-subunit alcohol dehydrogenase family)
MTNEETQVPPLTIGSAPLAGKTVVVVGGTSGMGRGAVSAAAYAGAHVIVAGRRALTERPEVATGPGSVAQAVVDAADEDSVKQLFDDVGEFDHLFVTAAPKPGNWGPLLTQDLTAARSYLDGKFWSSWLSARYGAEQIHRDGSITFLTGCSAIRPVSGAAMVTAAFGALEAMTPALALELGPVRVNTIRPGLIQSEMWDDVPVEIRDDFYRKARERFPVRRGGAVEDVGHAALFLMTNSFVTGVVLEVSGGEPLVTWA